MFLVAIFVVSLLSGATAAVVGFGIGSLLTPLLLTRFSPVLAVGAVALPHLFATALRFVQYRDALDKRILVRFGIPSACGGLAGALLQGVFADRGLFIALGGLLIATSIANLTHGFGHWKPQARVATILGLLSGVFGGLVGNQGGLRAAGMLAFDLSPRAYLATATAVALLIDVARTPVYLARAGNALLDLAEPIAIAATGCVIGTLVAERILPRMSPERYRQVVGVAVGALGIWLLLKSV